MRDFQKFLDESLPKIKVSEIENSDFKSSSHNIYDEIQEMVAHERKAQKVTQKELAKRTGLSQANISNIENGTTHPTIGSLQRIADALGKQLLISFAEREEN